MVAAIASTSDPRFLPTFEDHFADYWRLLAINPVDSGATGELEWAFTGLPHGELNAVFRARLVAERSPGELATLLDDMAHRAHRLGTTVWWWLPPLTTPTTLADLLPRHGFHPASNVPAMVADLADTPPTGSLPPDADIREVLCDADLVTAAHTFATGYGLSSEGEQALLAAHRSVKLGRDQPLRHFLAWRGSEAAAVASVYLRDGLSSINSVATAPAHRRLGLGGAVTAAAMAAARDAGYRLAVLEASAEGQPVYARLGFRTFAPIPLHAFAGG